jgi:hypothetical protein
MNFYIKASLFACLLAMTSYEARSGGDISPPPPPTSPPPEGVVAPPPPPPPPPPVVVVTPPPPMMIEVMPTHVGTAAVHRVRHGLDEDNPIRNTDDEEEKYPAIDDVGVSD